ncbi:hypothetical protein M413DRAFT_443500 [Hebeloma cylindrosporum]|uniref:Uncharacterized protein n=1 Tax=Hebeloma cylindrosporum TaxID=76867 RepID=A0A0C3CHD7_HEBCY|nr:hypothetical protein M413DRAFT_443500 [Hebeloma cylindrosporum h7]
MPYARVPGKLPPPRPDFSFTKRPKTKTREFFWRWRIWVEATFALTVYEPWEKVVVLTIFAILFVAMLTLMVNYLPRQLVFMRRRTMYYLWGEDWEERALWSYLVANDRGIDVKEIS